MKKRQLWILEWNWTSQAWWKLQRNERSDKRDAILHKAKCENCCRWKKVFIHFTLKLILKHQKVNNIEKRNIIYIYNEKN